MNMLFATIVVKAFTPFFWVCHKIYNKISPPETRNRNAPWRKRVWAFLAWISEKTAKKW